MKRIIYTALLSTALALPSAGVFAQVTSTTQNTTGTATAAPATTPHMASGAETDTHIKLISGAKLDHKAVEALQHQLNTRGYYKGRIDGKWGPNTMNALNRYEHETGGAIQPGGLINTATLNTLGIKLDSTISADGSNKTANTNLNTTTAPGASNNQAKMGASSGSNHALSNPALRTQSTTDTNTRSGANANPAITAPNIAPSAGSSSNIGTPTNSPSGATNSSGSAGGSGSGSR